MVLNKIFKIQILSQMVREMSTFTQKLNPITGSFDWILQNEDYDFHQEVARSSYADMLHDTERNKKYEVALKVAINYFHDKGQRANVLDIGTGTGLLSMFAARHGADSIVACEAFTPMSQCAIKIIDLNRFSNKIKVVPKRSTELTVGENGDLKIRANILVTEVFDTELIGEGALNTFKKAHEELLEKDCIVIPQSATMFAQVVEGSLIQNWNLLKPIHNRNGDLLLKIPSEIEECPGAMAVHDIQMSQLDVENFKTIISPQVVFEFDWSGKTPFVYDRTTIHTFKAERDGTAQAVFMWWELVMDMNNEIILSCAPYWAHPDYKRQGTIPWRDHWIQAVYYLPMDVNVMKDDQVHLLSCHDEFSLWFNLKKEPVTISKDDYIRPFCHCNLHTIYPRTRIGQLNDEIRSETYTALFEKYITKESVVLLLSHGFYHGLMAAKLGAKKVVCVEPSTLSISVIKSFVDCNNFDTVEIIKSVEDLRELNGDLKFNVVFSEPYFRTSIIPWDNLCFMYLLKDLGEFCTDDVQVFPRKVIIMGVAVEFSDLHKIRAPLNVCEGFKMEPFDELIETSSSISDDNVEAQPLWEYPCRALSQSVAIAKVDVENLKYEAIATTGNFNLEGNGICNGVALWVDWVFDEEHTVSTGPIEPIQVSERIKWDMHVRQGVHFINNRTFHGRIDYTFSFDCKNGVISFKIC